MWAICGNNHATQFQKTKGSKLSDIPCYCGSKRITLTQDNEYREYTFPDYVPNYLGLFGPARDKRYYHIYKNKMNAYYLNQEKTEFIKIEGWKPNWSTVNK